MFLTKQAPQHFMDVIQIGQFILKIRTWFRFSY